MKNLNSKQLIDIPSIDLRIIPEAFKMNAIDTASWALAFLDGSSSDRTTSAYDYFRVINNCQAKSFISINCLNLPEKHLAVIFYKNSQPIRLVLAAGNHNFHKIQNLLLNYYKDDNNRIVHNRLKSIFTTAHLEPHDQKNYSLATNTEPETKILSTRSYPTQHQNTSKYYSDLLEHTCQNFPKGKYILSPQILASYELEADGFRFLIQHQGGYSNDPDMTHFILFQHNAELELPEYLPPSFEL